MLSIHARQIVEGLVLPVLIFVAIALVFVGQVWPHKVQAVRLAVAGEMAPLYSVLTYPQRKVIQWETVLEGVTNIAEENARLRKENRQLQHWYALSTSLAAENTRLKSILHWGNDPNLADISGWVVRDESGPYLHAVLLDIGEQNPVHMGSVAVDANGIVGRVSEVGARVVRVLLINDATSRIPVRLVSSHADAIMAGDNSLYPRLMYYSQDVHPVEGERVETRGQTGITGGVAVGRVHYLNERRPVIVPDADLAHLDLVRVFDNDTALESPPAAGRVKEKPLLRNAPDDKKEGTFSQGLKHIWPFSQFNHE
ncbi:rod shape-determining protein MreC [Saccharibacter floricola]|uniref:Cell shape-determining protein MreC n=1 Tax=Saccharibacter floricola DSM 15669 TaxID=1123227 RepID=A0ABQ0NZX0_9PROT|nr:rod shape-determining protein MreC [Saccharibacter floricola]GBQ07595.1 rod shape-determining protein MreC [Saccharibacter floricola DSM 15669]